jgi:hypothetical protein
VSKRYCARRSHAQACEGGPHSTKPRPSLRFPRRKFTEGGLIARTPHHLLVPIREGACPLNNRCVLSYAVLSAVDLAKAEAMRKHAKEGLAPLSLGSRQLYLFYFMLNHVAHVDHGA